MAKKVSNKEKEKLLMEIDLLNKSTEINKFNYSLWASTFLAGIAIIFTLVQIIMAVFPEVNKIYFLSVGLIVYVAFAWYMGKYKFRPENKQSETKYSLMKEKYERLGLNMSKLEGEIKGKIPPSSNNLSGTEIRPQEGKKDRLFYVVLMVLGEFCILLDAGYMGYAMEHGIGTVLEKYFFWILLVLGIILRYWAEKYK